MCLILLLAVAAAWVDNFPDASSQQSTYERAYEEDPYVSESLAASEDSRTERTCWVNRSTSEVYANEVDENQ